MTNSLQLSTEVEAKELLRIDYFDRSSEAGIKRAKNHRLKRAPWKSTAEFAKSIGLTYLSSFDFSSSFIFSFPSTSFNGVIAKGVVPVIPSIKVGEITRA